MALIPDEVTIAWAPSSNLANPSSKIARVGFLVQDQAKLAIDFGDWFAHDTKDFIRFNLATTPANIKQAVDQLITALK